MSTENTTRGHVMDILFREPGASGREIAKRLRLPESTLRPLIKSVRDEMKSQGDQMASTIELPTVDPATLSVAPPFSDLFPIGESVLSAITESMIRDGFHASKPIEVWREPGLVIDGHTRRQAAIEAGIQVPVVYLDFDSEDDALEYAIGSQSHRRNLTDAEIARCVTVLDERKTRGGDRRSMDAKSMGSSDPIDRGRSADRTADLVGTSATKVKRIRTVMKNADEETKAEVLSGKTSINKAATKIRKDRKAKKAKAKSGSNGAVHGQSKVNGVLQDDPPDVAALRAAGKIAPGVVPDVTVPTDGPKIAASPDEDDLTDAAWLATLPLHFELEDVARQIFADDALVYRHLIKARSTFRHHATREMNATGRRGAYAYFTARYLKLDHPKDWVRCPATENGGCGGSGQVVLIGECPKCHGRGYWIK